MVTNKYISNGNCKFNISYHIVWIPKYRKYILKNNVENRFKQLLSEKISQLHLHYFVVECMPDHVHLFIKSNPNYTISYIVQQLKGYTSFKLRKEFSFLNKYKSLWANGYFCETIGNITQETVIIYINNQKYI
jgi:putative transposase